MAKHENARTMAEHRRAENSIVPPVALDRFDAEAASAECLIIMSGQRDQNAAHPSFRISRDVPNEYHKLDVRMAKPGLTARTRTGYDPQP
jgi:hypothetical protein